eukprot:TRINITY_DN2171_c0_g2_i1.p1 TRINITY_DN2171_c0_g2~~TRINITY_DN2171_c0_g2_i1.p1  ORF type:complete len:264 (-),score=79.84 TRINITY_DN2171_c0_g2_i1:504-1295(-)
MLRMANRPSVDVPETVGKLRKEYESLAKEVAQYKAQRDDFERKFQSQLNVLSSLHQAVSELERTHKRLKLQYEEEILKAKRGEFDTNSDLIHKEPSGAMKRDKKDSSILSNPPSAQIGGAMPVSMPTGIPMAPQSQMPMGLGMQMPMSVSGMGMPLQMQTNPNPSASVIGSNPQHHLAQQQQITPQLQAPHAPNSSQQTALSQHQIHHQQQQQQQQQHHHQQHHHHQQQQQQHHQHQHMGSGHSFPHQTQPQMPQNASHMKRS